MIKNIQAAIFDLDGTLMDTQMSHHVAEAAVLARRGIIVDPTEISIHYAGASTKEMFQRYAPEYDPEELWQEKWRLIYQSVRGQPVKPMPFAEELVRALHSREVLLAVASASPMDWINACVFSAGIHWWFKNFASGQEVAKNKPAPDVFLFAAQQLGVDPTNCVAIEDSRTGVEAAVSAGMQTYWLTQSKDAIPGAIRISSLNELMP